MSDPINLVAEAVKKSCLGQEGKASAALNEQGKKPEETVKKKKPTPLVLTPSQQKFSDVFEDAKRIRDHAVTIYTDTHWHKSIRPLIPVPIEGYVWPDALEILHSAIEHSYEPIQITGPTGCGKTSLISNYCAVTKRPFVRMNMRGDIDTSAILGMPQAINGETKWVDGPLTQAVRLGGVALLDEYDFIPPEIMYSIQWLLEDDPKLLLTDKADDLTEMMVHAHPDFRIIFAGNTKGQGDSTGEFPGAQVQSMATVDRCTTSITMDYLEEALERKIVRSKVSTLEEDQLDKLMQLVGIIRTGYKTGDLSIGMSPRTQVSFAKKWVYWDDPLLAFEVSYMNKLEEAEQSTCKKVYHRVFGSGGTLAEGEEEYKEELPF